MSLETATVTITSEEVETKSGVKDGKEWQIREQSATLETVEMRNPIKLALRKGQPAHKAGRYAFNVIKHIRISDFGSVQLARYFDLVPAK